MFLCEDWLRKMQKIMADLPVLRLREIVAAVFTPDLPFGVA